MGRKSIRYLTLLTLPEAASEYASSSEESEKSEKSKKPEKSKKGTKTIQLSKKFVKTAAKKKSGLCFEMSDFVFRLISRTHQTSTGNGTRPIQNQHTKGWNLVGR